MRMRNRNAVAAGDRMPAVDPTALPPDLAVCLETATVIPRHEDDEGVRAVVQIDSRGWVHDHDTTRTHLLRRWPELTEGQLRRALRHVDALVRRASVPPQTQRRRGWVHNW
jgi:hypothetical protein